MSSEKQPPEDDEVSEGDKASVMCALADMCILRHGLGGEVLRRGKGTWKRSYKFDTNLYKEGRRE